MNTVEITLTDLIFPANLEDKYCKFRPVISLKYTDSNNKPAFAREALPGLGSRDYYECEKDNQDDPEKNPVRHATQPRVDMDKADISTREIMFEELDIKTFERLEVEILDIDIKVKWEKILGNVMQMLPASALPFLPAGPVALMLVKTAIEKGSGKSLADLEKGLRNRLLGKEDGAARTIWVGNKVLANPPEKTITISAGGAKGIFSVTLEMKVS